MVAPADSDSITALQDRVTKLEDENKELEKRVEENYPTLAEKNVSHLATVATVVTSEVGVFGVVAAVLGTIFAIITAFNYVAEFREKLLNDAFDLSLIHI